MQKIYTIDQVAEILTVKPDNVRRMIKRRDIDAFKQGYAWRIPESALSEYVERKLKEAKEMLAQEDVEIESEAVEETE